MNFPHKVPDQWYKYAYDINMRLSSWTFRTKEDIDRVIELTNIKKHGKILDLACGYGRHSIELAKRGYKVVGIDVSPHLIDYAKKNAIEENLDIEFFCSDIREFKNGADFDMVLNLYDGAIGYLEDDIENLKIFSTISRHLKEGGISLIHLHRLEYAEANFPQKITRISTELEEEIWFLLDPASRYMMEVTKTVKGADLEEVVERKRLYSFSEIKTILKDQGLEVMKFAPDNLDDNNASDNASRYFFCVSKKL